MNYPSVQFIEFRSPADAALFLKDPFRKYVFKPYNSNFPKLFDNEKKRIGAFLQTEALIEHVGSTAIPDLGGKGVIDIAIAANREQLNAISAKLESLNYKRNKSFGCAERLFFQAALNDDDEGQRLYHIHLTSADSNIWKGLLSFRDHLICRPELAREYAKIKENAVFQAQGDGKKYRKLKDHFFVKVSRHPSNPVKPLIAP